MSPVFQWPARLCLAHLLASALTSKPESTNFFFFGGALTPKHLCISTFDKKSDKKKGLQTKLFHSIGANKLHRLTPFMSRLAPTRFVPTGRQSTTASGSHKNHVLVKILFGAFLFNELRGIFNLGEFNGKVETKCVELADAIHSEGNYRVIGWKSPDHTKRWFVQWPGQSAWKYPGQQIAPVLVPNALHLSEVDRAICSSYGDEVTTHFLDYKRTSVVQRNPHVVHETDGNSLITKEGYKQGICIGPNTVQVPARQPSVLTYLLGAFLLKYAADRRWDTHHPKK